MPDQKQDKDYTDAELTKMFRDSVKRAPDYIRKHIDVNRIRAVNATGQNPADYASADQKDAVNNKDAIADVRDGSRTVVHIYRPSEFAKDPDQIAGHEAVHFVQNGLPDEVKDKFAPVNAQDPYSYGGNAGVAADAKAGKPIESLSPEQQAALAQYSIAFDKFADKPTSTSGTGVPTAAQQDWENNRDNYKHYTQQIANWPQKPYSDDTEPIIKDDDPRLKIDMKLNPDLPAAGTIPKAAPTPVSNVSTGSFQAGMLFGPGDSAPGEPPPTDAFAKYAVTSPAASSPAPSDPFAKYAVGGPAPASEPASPASEPTAPVSSPAASSPAASDPFAKFAVNKPAATQNPLTGQPPNPNEGLLDRGKDTLKKAWNWANTPLTESLGGMSDSRAGAGGVERGVEKIASGFTSPLSIALTLGTFGTAGFIESAGASVLRDVAGMSAAEIADVAKGAEAITQATKTGQNYKEAIQAAGLDEGLVKKGMDALYAAGLKEGDLTGGNAAERGASLMFRKFAMTPAKAQIAAKTMQTAVNAGFTYQAVQQAAQMSPRALDALKEGDYDHFAEYATEALAGAAFGAAGASHAIHSAGELAEPLLENKLRPSDETRKFSNLFDALDGRRQQANEQARLLQQNTMKALGYKNPSNPLTFDATKNAQDLRLSQLFHGITLGFDKDLAAQHYNAIAEAAGRPDRLNPQNGPRGIADDWADLEKQVSSLTGKPSNEVSISDIEKSGGGRELQNQWADYMKRPFAPSSEDGLLAEHARTSIAPGDKNLSPVVSLNDYAHEAVSRSNQINFRDWSGMQLDRPEVLSLAEELKQKAKTPGNEGLSRVSDSLVKSLGNNDALVLQKQSAEPHTLTHEQIHTWQRQNQLSPEQVKNITRDPGYLPALSELMARGYSPAEGIDEVASHLGSGDYLDLDKNQAKGLLKTYLKQFGPESLADFPSDDKLTKQALKEAGHNENINRGATERLLEQATRVNGTKAPDVAGIPADRLRDLIANSDLKNKPADYIDHLLNVYKGVHEGFNDTEMAVAKDLRGKLQTGITDANANGIIKGQAENYMQRRWEKPNPTANRTIADAGMGKFTTNVSMAHKRVFESELEPILKGYQLRAENPITLTSQWLADTYKAIANRKLLSSVLDRNIRGSDGRPAVVLTGQGRVVEGSDGENPVTMVRKDAVRNIKIADPEIQNLKNTGLLDRYLDDQTILDKTPKVHPDTIPAFIDRLEKIGIGQNPQYDEAGNNILRQQIQTLKDIQSGKRPMSDLSLVNDAQKPVYVWRPQDYIHLDNPSMRKWNFVTHDPSGNGVLIDSDLAVHPEFADYLKTRLSLDESGLQKWGPTRLLLKGGAGVKKNLLSFSPFHMIQEGLRGVMMGIDPNPWNLSTKGIEDSPLLDPADPSKGTILQHMVSHRLTLEPDYKGLQDESEGVAGHSAILDKIPVIGKWHAWYQDFLFKKYIPSLKAQAGIKMFNEYREAHPDWTDDRVAEVASAHVNDTFGGINYKAMGRSAATQDWARLLTLAPDWLEAELRSGARLFGGDGSIARGQIAKLSLGLWGIARVLNYVTTGNFHNEAPFGLAVKNKDGKETIFSLRTLPTDLLHAATDPIGFMKGRFSPVMRAGQELYSGRDQFNRKLSPGDLTVDLARNLGAPLPFQAIGQALSGNGPEVGNTGQAVKALGGTAQVYRTEAQKLAAQIASDHSESGPIDPALLHRHRVIMRFEDQVRSGQMGLPEVYKMVVSGDLSQADAKKIAENVKVTRGMPADTASLYTRASRLPPKDFLSVWDISTPQEKTAMAPLMIKARKNYVKHAMTNETPQERLHDPLLHRFMNMFPQATPF